MLGWDYGRRVPDDSVYLETIRPLKLSFLSQMGKMAVRETELKIIRKAMPSLSSSEQQTIIDHVAGFHETTAHRTSDCSKLKIFEQLAQKLDKLSENTETKNSTFWTRLKELQQYQKAEQFDWTKDQDQFDKTSIELYKDQNALGFADER
jgi:adenosylmethionine-8-amino-7-oxononanoate aminotransferase